MVAVRSRLAVQLGQDQSNYDLGNHEDDQVLRALLVESGNGGGMEVMRLGEKKDAHDIFLTLNLVHEFDVAARNETCYCI